MNLQGFFSLQDVAITLVLDLSPTAQNNGDNNGNKRGNKLVVAAGCGFAVALLSPVIVPCALAGAGFGSVGVAGASFAALWQASLGNVAAGSLFATCTSAGMGGAGLGVLTSGLAAAGTGTGAACLAAGAACDATRSPGDHGEDDGENGDGNDGDRGEGDGGDGGGDGGGEGGRNDDGGNSEPKREADECNNRSEDEKQNAQTQQIGDAQLVVIIVPKEESQKWQVEKFLTEQGSKLHFKDETKHGSPVAFFVNRTPAPV